ncbi:phenylacetic acid degradation protein [Methylobacterium sp. Leaf99]|uniref:PaaI family thioesterase n=1 Tax=Methylobacterium sp. Leaf99 TaxID=1736251 RepID=UPI0006F8486D|nr:PaaI family thioesterase [Methylobacterium sp. Leaf99]KQP08137.1 phenylacetic acid degradation protein [Methylobacterium sp. Leaf99]
MSDTPPLALSLSETRNFLDAAFPQMAAGGRTYHLVGVGPLRATMRMDHHDRHLRPGGTVSGPSMMALADYALYAAILSNIGPVALAVTTSLNFNFLRRPGPNGLFAEARLLKLGRRLAVGEVAITAPDSNELVCHATGTYSIPPER